MSDLITIPRIVTRKFIQEHSDWIFLYGADYFRKGALGQMWHCHGEPNAYPLTTCHKLCPSSSSKYWNDSWELGWEALQKDMDMIVYHPVNGKLVIPLRKIGEGASRMIDMAPKMYKFMKDFIDLVAYKNIRIDYNAN